MQLLNQIRQLVGSPLDRQLEYVIQTFTSVVCPPVAAGGDVVAQEVYNPVADVRSQFVWHLQCQQLRMQAVNGALELGDICCCLLRRMDVRCHRHHHQSS